MSKVRNVCFHESRISRPLYPVVTSTKGILLKHSVKCLLGSEFTWFVSGGAGVCFVCFVFTVVGFGFVFPTLTPRRPQLFFKFFQNNWELHSLAMLAIQKMYVEIEEHSLHTLPRKHLTVLAGHSCVGISFSYPPPLQVYSFYLLKPSELLSKTNDHVVSKILLVRNEQLYKCTDFLKFYVITGNNCPPKMNRVINSRRVAVICH